MKLVGADQQQRQHFLFNADGAIVAGGTPQLVLARSMSRSFLFLHNRSNADLVFEIGYGTATATISNGAVTSISVVNAGFNYTKPPLVRLIGGGYPQQTTPGQPFSAPNTAYLGLNQPNGASPSEPAVAYASISNGSISAITIANAGSQYAIAPYVQIMGSDLDPYGCAAPSLTSGIVLAANEKIYLSHTAVPTDPIAVWGATTGQSFSCRWMD